MKAFTPAQFYASMIPGMREIATSHGYTLAIHGSMVRDCDLIAVPWTEEATDELTLIKALKEYTGGFSSSCNNPEWEKEWPDCLPTDKPHGRKGYVLHLTDQCGQGPYFDISVMPRKPSEEPK